MTYTNRDKDEQIGLLKSRISSLKDTLTKVAQFTESFGFVTMYKDYTCNGFYHPKMRDCSCGGKPVIREDAYDKGHWFAECNTCFARTESFRRVTELMKAWDRNQMTELSEAVQGELNADSMSIEGARNLVKAMGRQAASDYVASVKMGKPDKFIEDFFDGVWISGRPAIEALKEKAAIGTEDDENENDEYNAEP